MRDAREEPLLPIDHSRVIDSHGQLDGYVNYLPFDTFCGICDAACHVTPAMQKYILEANHVPVSQLARGAVFCEGCRSRRARIKALRKHDQWRRVKDGAAELNRLAIEEAEAQKKSLATYARGGWPYRHAV